MAPVIPPPDGDVLQRILETTRELEKLIAQAPNGEPDPDWEAFQAFTELHEFPDDVQVALLSEFLELALPDMARSARPLRTLVLYNHDIPEQELEALNRWTGIVPARLRQLEWLDAPGIHLAGDRPMVGTQAAQTDESGVMLGRALLALTDGRLALLHMVGTWTNPNRHARMVSTIADAQIIEPWRALQEFPLHQMLRPLRACLWGRLVSQGGEARAPGIEARRTRFTALVTGLDQATRAQRELLRRVGDDPA